MESRRCEVDFDNKSIQTLVTNRTSEIEQWIKDIYTFLNGNGAVVGLCIQYKPTASNKRCRSRQAATLQLCTDNKCLIIQVCHLERVPGSLKSFMHDPCFTFVGIKTSGCDVFRELKSEYGLVCGRYMRLHHLGRRMWPLSFGKKNRPIYHRLIRKIWPCMYVKSNSEKPTLMTLARLAEVERSVETMPMEILWSNWEASILNLGQIKYGCIHAYSIYKVGHEMLLRSSNSEFDEMAQVRC